MRQVILMALAILLAQTMHSQIFFSENFNQGIPAGWTITNGGSTSDTWFATTLGFSGQYLDGTEFLFVNSDAAGNGPTVCLDELVVSPPANTTGQPLVLLEFDQYFRHVGLTDSGFVEVFDGVAWQRTATYTASQGAFGSPNHQLINVTALANPMMQVRFRYNDNCNWAWYWAIDNVILHAPLTSDAGCAAITSPATNGRLLTSNALSAAEQVTITIENFGVDTLTNIPVAFRVNGGPAISPEIVPGPLPPLGTTSYTFTTTANLAAAGTYDIEVWTELALDASLANDTMRQTLRQILNPPRTLPIVQGFENAPDTVLTSTTVGVVAGLPELDFSTTGGAGGRMRTAAGPGFYNNGQRAVTLDKSPTGSPNAVNDVTLTYNMSGYDANQNMVLLAFSIEEHGDEVHTNDSVWVRGSDTLPWLGVSGWNTVTGANNGFWYSVTGIDLSALLVGNGQNFSTSFQIRLGQEDNFAASSPIASDGVSFDDIVLSEIVNINTGVTDILHPNDMDCGDSLIPVVLVLENFGLDTLTDIPVLVEVNGPNSFLMLDTLNGPLLPGTTDNLIVNSNSSFSGGTYSICAYTRLSSDSLPQDDTTCVSVTLLAPSLASIPADTICQGDSSLLQLTAPNPGILYTWWDSIAGGSQLQTGSSLQTPPLTSDTTFFVEANSSFRAQGGPPDNSFGTGGGYNILTDGLVFDVQQTMIIDTVFVYPSGNGIVTVNILDALNNPVGSNSVMVVGTGRKAIPVGVTVYPGTGYTMNAVGTTTGGLFRNDTAAVFPYGIPNVMLMTGTTNGLGASGFYYFWYDWRVTVPGCAGPRTPVPVTVLSGAPTAGFSTSVTQSTVAFTDTSAGGVQNWDWDFGDGNFSTQANPTHTYQQAGTYPICLRITNSCGTDSICDTLTVCPALQPGFTAQNTGLNISLSDTSTDALSWFWQFGDGNVDSVANPMHSYAVDGRYEICLRVENICQQVDSICDSIAVCAPILANFSAQQQPGNGLQYAFSDLSSGMATSWAWDFGDGNFSSLQNPNHTYTQAGALQVQLIVSNLCGEQDTLMQNLQVVGLEAALFGTLEIYPNPNAGNFVVEFREMVGEQVSLKLFDLPGRQVWHDTGRARNGKFERRIRLETLPVGMYWLEVEVDGQKAVRRVVVQ